MVQNEAISYKRDECLLVARPNIHRIGAALKIIYALIIT